MNKLVLVLIAASTLTLSACGLPANQLRETASPTAKSSETVSDAKTTIAAETKTPSPSSSAVVTRTPVLWADYEPGTQAEIDMFAKNKDCRGLQTYVGMATATEAAIKAKSGHGAEALLKYIGESLTLAACN